MTQRTPPRDDGEVDLLAQYCREVARYQVLDAFTAATLAQKAQGGDKLARTDLVHANLRLVIPLARVAARTTLRGREVMDLIQIGNLALMGCIDGYRTFEGGASFGTWAQGAVRIAYLSERTASHDIPTVSFSGDIEDRRDDPTRQEERLAADEQFLASARAALTAREFFVVARRAGLEPGVGVWSHREIATALGIHKVSAQRIVRRARAKLRPYLAAYLQHGSGPVLSSVSRALEPPGKRTPPLSLMAGTNGANAADATHADLVMVTTAPDQLPLSATQPNRLPSRFVRQRPQDKGPTPLSAAKPSTVARGRSNATEKKTA